MKKWAARHLAMLGNMQRFIYKACTVRYYVHYPLVIFSWTDRVDSVTQ